MRFEREISYYAGTDSLKYCEDFPYETHFTCFFCRFHLNMAYFSYICNLEVQLLGAISQGADSDLPRVRFTRCNIIWQRGAVAGGSLILKGEEHTDPMKGWALPSDCSQKLRWIDLIRKKNANR